MHTVILNSLLTREYLFKSSVLDIELQTLIYKIKFESLRHCHKSEAYQEMESKESFRFTGVAKPRLFSHFDRTAFQNRFSRKAGDLHQINTQQDGKV